MGIKLSDEAKEKFVEQNFTQAQIEEIEENAKSLPNAELVAKEAFVLRSNNFLTARIIDFACSPAPIEVLAKTIHDSDKLLAASLTRGQITEIATHAKHESDVSTILRLAQKAENSGTSFDKRNLEQSLKLLRTPQATYPAEASATQPLEKQEAPALSV